MHSEESGMRPRLVYICDSSKRRPLPVLNEGLAIGVAKNVKIRPYEFTLPARTVVDISGASSQFQDIDTQQVWGHELRRPDRSQLDLIAA